MQINSESLKAIDLITVTARIPVDYLNKIYNMPGSRSQHVRLAVKNYLNTVNPQQEIDYEVAAMVLPKEDVEALDELSGNRSQHLRLAIKQYVNSLD